MITLTTEQAQQIEDALKYARNVCVGSNWSTYDVDVALSVIRAARAQGQAEPKCNPHPDAPHGFDRNASHSANRYVCECEGWEPEQAEQEPVAWMNEDELPEKYPYDLMYKYSKVDVVRMFPVFAPSKCEQEPLYFGLTNDHTWISITEYKYNKLKDKYRMKVYTTPPSVEAAIDWSNLDFQCHALQQIGANWYDGKVRNQWIADTCYEMKKHIAAAIRSMK